jgi:hypothetical protein
MHDAGETGRTRADTPPNPSRRTMLLLTGTAAAVARGAPHALAAADGPDAELIRLCDRLMTLEAAQRTILSAQRTTEDELRDEPKIDAISAEQKAVFDLITELPQPVTQAGAGAMARAALPWGR